MLKLTFKTLTHWEIFNGFRKRVLQSVKGNRALAFCTFWWKPLETSIKLCVQLPRPFHHLQQGDILATTWSMGMINTSLESYAPWASDQQNPSANKRQMLEIHSPTKGEVMHWAWPDKMESNFVQNQLWCSLFREQTARSFPSSFVCSGRPCKLPLQQAKPDCFLIVDRLRFWCIAQLWTAAVSYFGPNFKSKSLTFRLWTDLSNPSSYL